MIDLNKTKTVDYGELSVTVRLASYKIGVIREWMLRQAHAAEQVRLAADPNPDRQAEPGEIVDITARTILHPLLMCGVTCEHSGFDHWPLTPEEITDLPQPFVEEWEQAVYDLNPTFRPIIPPSPQEKKDDLTKASTQSSG